MATPTALSPLFWKEPVGGAEQYLSTGTGVSPMPLTSQLPALKAWVTHTWE